MDTYRTIKFRPDHYAILSGKEKHEVEIPFAEDLDLWVEWKADRDLIVWLYFEDGKQVPFANGLRGHFSIRTHGVISVVIACTKSTTAAVCVSYKDLSVKEKKDWTPVEITPPPPAELKLADAVRRELARLGIGGRDDETITVSEEDNLEEDDEPDEFGAGYMESEEPAPVRLRAKAAQSAAKSKPSGDPGDDGGSGVAPDNPGSPVE